MRVGSLSAPGQGDTVVNMRRLIALILVLIQTATAQAQELGAVAFPPGSKTAQEAIDNFDERARRIIQYVACGREANYYLERKNLRDDDEYQANEGLLEILIGKVAWLTRLSEGPSPACKYDVVVGSDDPSSTIPQSLAIITDQSLPTRCASMQFADIGGSKIFSFEVTADCMRAQINEGVRAMRKTTIAGTTGIPCFGSSSFPFVFSKTEGEYDVVLRNLTRLFYMGTAGNPILEPATINHMWEKLLSLRGAPADDSLSPFETCANEQAGQALGTPEDYADRQSFYREALDAVWHFFEWFFEYIVKVAAISLISTTGIGVMPFVYAFDPASDPTGSVSLRIGESENHRLMIESARYLTNRKMLEALNGHDNYDKINEQQSRVREWILKKLQEIANSDFREYNARPYTRYSLNAITNLYEYSGDDKIKTASQIVLDLSAAKFSASSNVGRRIVPLRRLATTKVDESLYLMCCGGDNEIVRGMVFTGQTQLIDDNVPAGHVPGMIFTAAGTYRWPRQVIEAAVAGTPGHGSFAQSIVHDGIESYWSTPTFTMSLGGIPTGPDQSFFGINPTPEDHGAAVPTMILPTVAGSEAVQVFRIKGSGTEEDRSPNLCGYRGFICGTNPDLPKTAPNLPFSYGRCTIPPPGAPPDADGITFITSIGCFPAGPHFYAAMMQKSCNGDFCDEDNETWGLIEVTRAPGAVAGADAAYDQFRAERRAALLGAIPDADGKGTYVDTAGRSIEFLIHKDGSKIRKVDGAAVTFDQTIGTMIRREVANGEFRTVIGSPTGGREINMIFNQWDDPRREEP